ncbi:MAG TPA: MarR family transcriptional regulator [Chthoniobacterales bacterium]|nr:MarR family transcriptional regulator [Chthoniobacterales bacterium]
MAPKKEDEAAALAGAMMALVRSFGLHRPHGTPCGRPIPVAEAHALTDLATDGPMNQGELARRLRLEKSTVSRLVRQLEKRRWIRRAGHAQDGRVVLLQLTAEGRRAAERLGSARSAKFDQLLAGIPKTKRAQILAALTTLVAAMED